jgi:hypothetical protein
VLELTGDDHNHNASNHGINSRPATACDANDDHNAHERRLLIAKADRGYVCSGRARHSVRAVNEMRRAEDCPLPRWLTPRAFALRFCRRRYCGLRLFFFGLTDYRRDRLKFFTVAEIH